MFWRTSRRISFKTFERVSLLSCVPPEEREETAREFAQYRAANLAQGGTIPTPEDLAAIDRQLARMRAHEGPPTREEYDALGELYMKDWPPATRAAMRKDMERQVRRD